MTWWVVETQRHREPATRTRLEQQGLAAYLPLMRQWPRPAVGSDVAPLFPGYLFVRASARRLHRVQHTPGVRGLVVFGGEPARLNDAVIDFLRAREGADGIVRTDPLPGGAAVRITNGPLRGLVAVLDSRLIGRERVLVLLDILQRQTRVEMPETWVCRA